MFLTLYYIVNNNKVKKSTHFYTISVTSCLYRRSPFRLIVLGNGLTSAKETVSSLKVGLASNLTMAIIRFTGGFENQSPPKVALPTHLISASV